MISDNIKSLITQTTRNWTFMDYMLAVSIVIMFTVQLFLLVLVWAAVLRLL